MNRMLVYIAMKLFYICVFYTRIHEYSMHDATNEQNTHGRTEIYEWKIAFTHYWNSADPSSVVFSCCSFIITIIVIIIIIIFIWLSEIHDLVFLWPCSNPNFCLWRANPFANVLLCSLCMHESRLLFLSLHLILLLELNCRFECLLMSLACALIKQFNETKQINFVYVSIMMMILDDDRRKTHTNNQFSNRDSERISLILSSQQQQSGFLEQNEIPNRKEERETELWLRNYCSHLDMYWWWPFHIL